jgi:hypothetical protein
MSQAETNRPNGVRLEEPAAGRLALAEPFVVVSSLRVDRRSRGAKKEVGASSERVALYGRYGPVQVHVRRR